MRCVFPLLVLSVLSTTACNWSTTGEEGVLEFNYSSAVLGLAGLSTPVAVGASASITVREIGSEDDLSIDDASSSDTETLSVEGMAGTGLSIRAHAAGTAKLEVDATSQSGATLQDRVELNTVVPYGIELVAACNGNESTAPVLTGRAAYVRYRFVTEDDSTVLGDDYYPLHAVDEAAAAVNVSESRAGLFGTPYMAIDIGAQAGDIVLQSDLERADEVTFRAVAPSAIDGVSVENAATTLAAGESKAQKLRPEVGGEAICPTSVPYDIESLTPETCTVSKTSALPLTPGYLEAGGALGFRVEGILAGACSYQVTLPSLGGDGVTETFDLTIETPSP